MPLPLDRRSFLRTSARVGGAGLVLLGSDALDRVAQAATRVAGRTAPDVARDEDYWREIQLAFTLDRSIINLNNGGVCPSPRVVHEAFKRYLDISNGSPAYHMWQLLEPNKESVRRQLAASVGCDPEELAITRNASEALQIAQLGIDLAPGDEVLTTNQDYPRMLDTWEQRVRRDRIVLKKISFPVPAPSLDDLAWRFEEAVTPRTKVIHVCHITNLTGQIFPIRAICDMARARGIRTIVDGAHAYGQFPFAIRDLGCDYYGSSLHKWLLAPVGTGFLYVRRERIAGLWPLTPANEKLTGDIRKFEEIGTHPAANALAIAEALVFQETIGIERKAARLRYLRSRWTERLRGEPGVQLFTSDDPAMAGAIGTVGFAGVDPAELTTKLWDRFRIIVTPIKHPEYQGIRVTPNVYTTLQELDTFVEAIRTLRKDGAAERSA
ncbi:MAG TPA: aminotransferase class V-fold PLP-dependent enzyme [Vicinamibacterales bacterium]